MNSDIVRACEEAWRAIQEKYPEVPDVVMVVGSGGRRAATLYGHFAHNAWSSEKGDLHEVLIVAEQLHRGAEAVFTTLLHESVHGLANSREIKDTSGARHNKKFAQLCEEVGMIPPERPDMKLGFSAAILSDEAKEDFNRTITNLAEVLVLNRSLKLKPKETTKTSWVAECGCGDKIRLGKKLINQRGDLLRINCEICQSVFVVEDSDED